MLRHQPSRIDLRAEDQKELQAVNKALAEKLQAATATKAGSAPKASMRSTADRLGLK